MSSPPRHQVTFGGGRPANERNELVLMILIVIGDRLLSLIPILARLRSLPLSAGRLVKKLV